MSQYKPGMTCVKKREKRKEKKEKTEVVRMKSIEMIQLILNDENKFIVQGYWIVIYHT